MSDEIKELLMEALVGESLARNKYTFFAEAAKKEGYQEISKIFELTANNEKEHAKIWFKYLELLSNTEKNLDAAALGEEYEHQDMYPKLSQKALELGDKKLADLFLLVGQIEAQHAMHYRKLLKEVAKKEVFVKDESQTWICMNCGHVYEGKEALSVCPVCIHPQGYFAVKKE